jgi:hypothetical protein
MSDPGDYPDQGGAAGEVIAAPKNLRLKAVAGGLELYWEASAISVRPVSGYEIVRSIQMLGGPYGRIAKVDSGVNRYVDRTAPLEALVYYKVRAVAGRAHSPYSNTVAGERPPHLR